MQKLFLAATVVTAGLVASSSHAATMYALTDENSILTFDSSAPSILTNAVPLRTAANQAIQDLVGIDIRPANNTLYGLGRLGQIYTINPNTGIATPTVSLAADPSDGSNPFSFLSGSRFGFDFNPVADRLRLVSDVDQNLRINVDTGEVTTDGTINPSTANVTQAAYANNVGGVSSTTLYVIDPLTDTLNIQSPPNDGTLTAVGPLGLDVSSLGGFDILTQGQTNIGFASLQDANLGVSRLYTINLATGAATLVGVIGGGDLVDGLTVAIPEPTTLGVLGGALSLALRRRSR